MIFKAMTALTVWSLLHSIAIGLTVAHRKGASFGIAEGSHVALFLVVGILLLSYAAIIVSILFAVIGAAKEHRLRGVLAILLGAASGSLSFYCVNAFIFPNVRKI